MYILRNIILSHKKNDPKWNVGYCRPSTFLTQARKKNFKKIIFSIFFKKMTHKKKKNFF